MTAHAIRAPVPVTTKDRAAWRDVPAAERIERAHKLIVLHPRFREAVELLKHCHETFHRTGEPACVSLEAVGEATLKIDLEKNTTLQFPMLRLEGHTLCVGMGRSIHEAQGIALDHAYHILLKVHDLTPGEAYAYACARVSLRFAGPASPTVLAVVPDPDMQ